MYKNYCRSGRSGAGGGGGAGAGLGLASVLESRGSFARPSSVVGLSSDPQQGQNFRESMSQAR
jgi:hypothetical protein